MFSERFTVLLKDRNITAYKVAKDLKINAGTVTKWTNGVMPDIKNIKILADYFDIDIDYFLKDNISNVATINAPINAPIAIAQNYSSNSFNISSDGSTTVTDKVELNRIFDLLDKQAVTKLKGYAYDLWEASISKLRHVVMLDVHHDGFVDTSCLNEGSPNGHTKAAYMAVLDLLCDERILIKEGTVYKPSKSGKVFIDKFASSLSESLL